MGLGKFFLGTEKLRNCLAWGGRRARIPRTQHRDILMLRVLLLLSMERPKGRRQKITMGESQRLQKTENSKQYLLDQ
jgi:hypothetical protein